MLNMTPRIEDYEKSSGGVIMGAVSERYRPINIEAISKDQLSKFRLFMFFDGRFVLYKDNNVAFTLKDTERLIRNNVTNLYVLYGDFEDYNTCVENNLRDIVKSTDSIAKTSMIVQASANYIDELFHTPAKELPQKMSRARMLVKSILSLSLKDPQNLQLISDIISKSAGEYAHAVNVASISLALADSAYKLHTDELVDLGLGALLHDIGKIYLNDAILDKPLSVLNESQLHAYYSHPETGYSLMLSLPDIEDSVLDVIRNHHEHEDATGFPRKLGGRSLCRSVKIVALANAYCEFAAPKAYREAMTPNDAISTIERDMTLWFYPNLVTKLKELVLNEKI
jgi:HD-GYP domain-containing protein (c-di-GMP phosphodiesterase class II)